MSHSPLELLRHILDEIEFLQKESGELTEETFSADEKSKRAFTRSVEIIGEASKKLPDEYRQRNDHIDWKPIIRMRDKLIHHYFGVDYAMVWDTVKTEIPKFRTEIIKLIEAELVDRDNGFQE